MLKKRVVQGAILLGCSLPYAFWGIYGDAMYRTMAGYLPLLICMGLLCWLAFRTGNLIILLAGNAVSFLTSYGWVGICFPAAQWSWYFKPFVPLDFLKAVSAAALLAQVFLIYLFHARKSCAEKNKEESL